MLGTAGGVAVDGAGNVYVTDTGSNNVLKISASAGSVVRNGSGVNPRGYAEVSQAIIGSNWETTVDVRIGTF